MVVLGGGAVSYERGTPAIAAEREGNPLKGLKDFRLKMARAKDQNLALTVLYVPLTVLYVPSSLDGGPQTLNIRS